MDGSIATFISFSCRSSLASASSLLRSWLFWIRGEQHARPDTDDHYEHSKKDEQLFCPVLSASASRYPSCLSAMVQFTFTCHCPWASCAYPV